MSWLSKITEVATGGIGQLFFDVAKTYFPPDMSEADKKAALLEFEKLEMQRNREAHDASVEAENALTQRIKDLEGTAADLARIPVLGTVVLFLRGCQRPLWGFAVLYLDWKWFTEWELTQKQESALLVINLLVLGFLFGERAVKNVSPFLVEVFRAKKG
ncbi:hypothetical protein [uncultured Microbulbifer sp.]|uniref:hypothetical protein n=1 Tax=uncultured Microbulbifer sp. TaxID=348147 RepID=UPI002637847C|nr:hypothetical protein [uncultured Microbulbifer sp.]